MNMDIWNCKYDYQTDFKVDLGKEHSLGTLSQGQDLVPWAMAIWIHVVTQKKKTKST